MFVELLASNSRRIDDGFFCDKLAVDLSQLQRKGVHATHFSLIQVYLTFLYVSTYIHRLMVYIVIHIKAFKIKKYK